MVKKVGRDPCSLVHHMEMEGHHRGMKDHHMEKEEVDMGFERTLEILVDDKHLEPCKVEEGCCSLVFLEQVVMVQILRLQENKADYLSDL